MKVDRLIQKKKAELSKLSSELAKRGKRQMEISKDLREVQQLAYFALLLNQKRYLQEFF